MPLHLQRASNIKQPIDSPHFRQKFGVRHGLRVGHGTRFRGAAAWHNLFRADALRCEGEREHGARPAGLPFQNVSSYSGKYSIRRGRSRSSDSRTTLHRRLLADGSRALRRHVARRPRGVCDCTAEPLEEVEKQESSKVEVPWLLKTDTFGHSWNNSSS